MVSAIELLNILNLRKGLVERILVNGTSYILGAMVFFFSSSESFNQFEKFSEYSTFLNEILLANTWELDSKARIKSINMKDIFSFFIIYKIVIF